LRKSWEEGLDAALIYGSRIELTSCAMQVEGFFACSVAAKADYLMITVLVGINNIRVPFGIGIIQTAWKENELVKYGSSIEDLVRHRHHSAFLNLDADDYTYVGKPPNISQL